MRSKRRAATPAEAVGLVLDTGALVALDKGDLDVLAHLVEARARNRSVTIPTGALSQAWRDGQRQSNLARLLKQEVVVAGVDAAEARRIGELLRVFSKSRDVVDAHVVLVAFREGSAVMTSDPADMRALGLPADRIVAV